jgi:hypothetical protein
MRKIAICSLLFLALPFAGKALAQDEPQAPATSKAPETIKVSEPPIHYYHLDFIVRELDENGKPVNSRAYSCTVSTARPEFDSVRVGSKVPIATGSYDTNDNQVAKTQFQYLDVGVNFDVSQAREVGNNLAISLKAEISSLASTRHFGGANGFDEPVFRQNRWQAPVLVPLGKPTVVFTSDDVDSKGGMQVEVTATLLQ